MVKCKTLKQKEILENLSISINVINLLFILFVFPFVFWSFMTIGALSFIASIVLLATAAMIIASLAKSNESDDEEANKIQIASNSMTLFFYVFVIVLYGMNVKINKKSERYEKFLLFCWGISVLINCISIYSMSYSMA